MLIAQGRTDLAIAVNEAVALKRFRLKLLQDLVRKHKGKDIGPWKARVHRFKFQSPQRIEAFTAELKKMLGPYAGYIQRMGTNIVAIPEWMVKTAVKGHTLRAHFVNEPSYLGI